MAAAIILALSACAQAGPAPQSADFAPEYQGVEAKMLGRGLLQVEVGMRGARDEADVERFAQCVVAKQALNAGFGFARHLRTLISREAGLWRADSVYMISAALPPGSKTIDAEVVAADCAEHGIPMV